MRSALVWVLAILIVQKGYGAIYEDFNPTPIPLQEWNPEHREVMPGTLQEVVTTAATTTVAVIPPHYWEDALRHSVYLTLVRDKIDQLIAKGSVIAPNTKEYASEEINDHNLWDKIKSAPFDRLKPEESAPLGDITIVAKGRLLDDNGVYRFTQDDMSKEKCNNERCFEGVKAFWSVKRARQRDSETIPGKYHYELTFSVTSQLEKKHAKPYENPVRTFTVRESNPAEGFPVRVPEQTNYISRPSRAIWVHKNLRHRMNYQNRKTYQSFGLDRFLLSLFSDDAPKDDYANQYKPVVQYPHHKHGNGGVQSKNTQLIKNVPVHPLKPPAKFIRPIPPHLSHHAQAGMVTAPIQTPPLSSSHILTSAPTSSISTVNPLPPPHPAHDQKKPYKSHYHSYKHHPPHSNMKPATTTSSIPTYANLNLTMELPTLNLSDPKSQDHEMLTYKFHKQSPSKSHFSDHVRRPVFNAPPGVFINKKPFKPMPPLKLTHIMKPAKIKPIDFRPSPEVLDAQFQDPEPSSEAFRPIMTLKYGQSNDTDYSAPHPLDRTKQHIKLRTKVKIPHKHDNIKMQRTTTTAPDDIITAHNLSMEQISLDTMHWANNVLGAFSKTTPIASSTQVPDILDNLDTEFTTLSDPTTTNDPTTIAPESPEPTTVGEPSTTTRKPVKRTRPPHIIDKPLKVKKHKRIPVATRTTTEASVKQKDLTPLSAASKVSKTSRQGTRAHNDTQSTTTTTTSTTTASPTSSTSVTTESAPTTARPTKTATTQPPIITTTNKANFQILSKDRNRLRQSTLMLKGTSVKHDKWNTPPTNLDKSKAVIPLGHKSTLSRRKASNFQGYVSTTAKNVIDERQMKEHTDEDTYVTSTEVLPTDMITRLEIAENIDDRPIHDEPQTVDEEFEEMNDKAEFLFNIKPSIELENANMMPNYADVTTTTMITINTTPKNMTKKCTKKKQLKSTTTEATTTDTAQLTDDIIITTESLDDESHSGNRNISDKFTQTDPVMQGSEKSHFDLEVQKFLESIETSTSISSSSSARNQYDDIEDSDYSYKYYKGKKENDHESYDDFQEHQYSFLDLMMD